MNQKQKNTLLRIIVSGLIFAALMALEQTGQTGQWNSVWLLLAFFVPYGIIGYDVVRKAVVNIIHGQIFDENFLMMLATFGAFGIGEYAEAVAVMLFYQIGELFQSYAVGKSRQSITELMDICPEYANIEEEGVLSRVDPEDVQVGSVIVVRPGERIPLDGVVVDGSSMVDTAALTGESVPRRVLQGDAVISGCVNGSGTLRVRTTKEFGESTVAQILELVENASSKKARLENFITRFARYYTPVVTIGAVILAFVPPLLFGGAWADWIARACTFLVISCPCALVISVPLGFFGGIGAASRIGVLVKGSNYLEAVGEVTTVVFDKTGTLTKGEFRVSRILPEGMSRSQLLELAALGEGYSNHPIAVSIRDAFARTAQDKDMAASQEAEPESLRPKKAAPLSLQRVTGTVEIAGQGIRAEIDNRNVLLGNAVLMQENDVFPKLKTEEDGSSVLPELSGSTVVHIAVQEDEGDRMERPGNSTSDCPGYRYAGAIVISDTVKEDAGQAIREMKQAGVRKCVMLTGDRKEAALAVAKELGIDEVHAELLPADKVACVESLLKDPEGTGGRLAFVGDGINDAPVLSRADVGIAMGSLGSDAAIEAADIVIMDDDLCKIGSLLRISRGTLTIVRQNIVFALAVKFLALFLGALGIANMWMAVFADVGVAVLAILNSMRTLKMGKKEV